MMVLTEKRAIPARPTIMMWPTPRKLMIASASNATKKSPHLLVRDLIEPIAEAVVSKLEAKDVPGTVERGVNPT